MPPLGTDWAVSLALLSKEAAALILYHRVLFRHVEAGSDYRSGTKRPHGATQAHLEEETSVTFADAIVLTDPSQMGNKPWTSRKTAAAAATVPLPQGDTRGSNSSVRRASTQSCWQTGGESMLCHFALVRYGLR
ncbi:ferrochelatase-like protein [Leptomonas pyrrhocoris]|uniref:Ferrochelatase-like protein n=1 Tax=Leptomonas pyrrhocoris TaxID=157538 RepID=A0A0M9FQP0_LEPPY|nr:ferrochelatase-like protein [Leptomonas pyrrhocoris]KPA74033.1 ferrochelatase-like protein [Leptomonas pyrrhocoris]|eukprot:XP_015652472.1 ferrochelatase-like protein [Leptomonas pyrrhocoris]